MTNVHPPEPRRVPAAQRGETPPPAVEPSAADADIVVPRVLLERVAALLLKDYQRFARREIKQALDTLHHGLKQPR